jgi:probable DNA metabolism protein
MILLYDDTYDGLLTAVFEAFARKGDTSIRAAGRSEELSMFDGEEVRTCRRKSDRVMSGMQRLDPALPDFVYKAHLSFVPGMEDVALAVLRLGFQMNKSPLPLRQVRCVWQLHDIAKKVGGQAGKYVQLIRLHRVLDDLYAADIEPDYHVLPLIGQHFHDRFCDSRLIIRDLTHRLAIVSDPKQWHITELPPGEIPPIPKDRDIMDLWRTYFKTIANPHRKNLRLQRQFVPKKYRRHVVEFNDDV